MNEESFSSAMRVDSKIITPEGEWLPDTAR